VASPTEYSRFVVGYHGCDSAVARRALLGKTPLAQSVNDYDWLGRGVYFWEQGPSRAFQFAIGESKRSALKIKDPDYVGAYIYLGKCFDLLDIKYTEALSDAYVALRQEVKSLGISMPRNSKRRADGTKLFHRLDRAVIEFAINLLGSDFDTVRGAFWEGKKVYPGAEIRAQSHIQIAVRNPECVLGYFKPPQLTFTSARGKKGT
jgi:hypothetical protein